MGVGEAVGPIASGILAESYGFRMSNDLLGITMTVFTVLFFCFNGNLRLFIPDTQVDQTDIDDNYQKYKDIESAGPRSSTLETDAGTTLHSEPAEQLRHIPQPPLRSNRNTSLRLEI